MFEAILGSAAAERALVFINAQGEGYARDIAGFFGCGVTPIWKQLEKFETAGVLYSEPQGRTRLYRLDPRYALYKEIKSLLDKMLTFYPPDQQEQLLMNRRRPRRKNKPI